jgi:hypothetical protein
VTADRTGVVHVHSNYSHDGRDSLEQLRDFALDRGIAFIALTDHAEDFSESTWQEYVQRCGALSDSAVRLIPGLEFRFAGYRGLHLLAFGLDRWIEPRTPDEFIALAGSASRCTAVAHPILADYALPPSVRNGIDAIEVWNATYNTRYLPDPRALRLLHDIRLVRPRVVGLAGLDQHDRRNDRQTRVVLRDQAIDPVESLREGRFVNVGRTMRFDSGNGMGGIRLALLSAVRWAFDRVERAQDSVARALRSRRGAD